MPGVIPAGPMSYVVLARKWRPQSFEDLVGQEHVARTLGNAIAEDRVAHAFLFTGVRGVGKTSSARILAKSLNCKMGPTLTPCQKCSACEEITAGRDVDVQEIDGASYNGVDEVRRLQESLPYAPQRDRFKIFIVDEVHMLSNAAWNAFLKTLEEPPPHVKFIFATTEVQKVPVTILSRCQRYDFKLISLEQIVERLKVVLKGEKLKAADAALHMIAREAGGSMRDAMSLLDQVLAWSGKDALTAEGVADVLGIAPRQGLFDLAASVIEGDAAVALERVAEFCRSGHDIVHLSKSLLDVLRDVVVAKVAPGKEAALGLVSEETESLKALAVKADADDLNRLFLGFSKSFDDIARSGDARTGLEMVLVRLARRPALKSVEELLSRMANLEARLGGGSGGSGSTSGSGAGAGSRAATGTSPPARSAMPAGGPGAGARPAAVPPGASAHAAHSQAPVAAAARTGGPIQARVDWDSWRKVLGALRAKHPALASVFEQAGVAECTAQAIRLLYEPNSFLAAKALEVSSHGFLVEAGRQVWQVDVLVSIDVDAAASTAPSLARMESEARAAHEAELKRVAAEHPLVRAMQELLGAEIKEIRVATDVN